MIDHGRGSKLVRMDGASEDVHVRCDVENDTSLYSSHFMNPTTRLIGETLGTVHYFTAGNTARTNGMVGRRNNRAVATSA